MDHVKRVRECAAALSLAIAEARAAGYRVDGGSGLDIAVSETSKVVLHTAPAVKAEPPRQSRKPSASAPTTPNE